MSEPSEEKSALAGSSDISNNAIENEIEPDVRVRTTSEVKLQVRSYFIYLFERNKDVLQSIRSESNYQNLVSDKPESNNQNPVSDKPRKRSKSVQVDEKPKSKVHKRSRSYKIRRKLSTSDSDKKSRSSKSSKDTNSEDLMSELLASLQEMKVNEIKIDKKYSCEAPATLIKHGNETIVRYDTKDEVQDYFGLFKRFEIASSPIESSDSGTLTPDSDEPESRSSSCGNSFEKSSSTSIKSEFLGASIGSEQAQVRDQSKLFQQYSTSNLSEQSTKSDSVKRCPRSNLPEPCIKLKLSRFPDKISILNRCESSIISNPSKKPKPLDPFIVSWLYNPAGNLDEKDPFVPSNLTPLFMPSKLATPSETSKMAYSPAQSEVTSTSARSELLNSSTVSKDSKSSSRPKQIDSFAIPKKLYPSAKPKHLDPSVRPKQLDPSVRPKQLDPSAGPKQLDPSARPKELEPSVKLTQFYQSVERKQLDTSVERKQLDMYVERKQLDTSVEQKHLDTSVRPKEFDPAVKLRKLDPSIEVIFPSLLGQKQPKKAETKPVEPLKEIEDQLVFEYKLEAFILKRRHHILFISKTAERVKLLMESIALLKDNEQDNEEVIHVRWKPCDATDWLKVFYYWSVVKEDFNIMLGNISVIYEVLFTKSILPTHKQFHDFMEHFELACKEARDLHETCLNGMLRFTLHCTALDQLRFFEYATTFIACIGRLLRYLGDEVREIQAFKRTLSNCECIQEFCNHKQCWKV